MKYPIKESQDYSLHDQGRKWPRWLRSFLVALGLCTFGWGVVIGVEYLSTYLGIIASGFEWLINIFLLMSLGAIAICGGWVIRRHSAIYIGISWIIVTTTLAAAEGVFTDPYGGESDLPNIGLILWEISIVLGLVAVLPGALIGQYAFRRKRKDTFHK